MNDLKGNIVKYCSALEKTIESYSRKSIPLTLQTRAFTYEPRQLKCFAHGHTVGSQSRNNSLIQSMKNLCMLFVSALFCLLGIVVDK